MRDVDVTQKIEALGNGGNNDLVAELKPGKVHKRTTK